MWDARVDVSREGAWVYAVPPVQDHGGRAVAFLGTALDGPVKYCRVWVRPPGSISRLFGVTFESRIARAVRKVAAWCRRKNIEDGEIEKEIARMAMRGVGARARGLG